MKDILSRSKRESLEASRGGRGRPRRAPGTPPNPMPLEEQVWRKEREVRRARQRADRTMAKLDAIEQELQQLKDELRRNG